MKTRTFKILSMFILSLSACALYAKTMTLENWHQNYKRPEFFIQQDTSKTDDDALIHPDDPQLSGYLFEINNQDLATSIVYISRGLSHYLSDHAIQTNPIINTPNVSIFFMPKNNSTPIREFYKKFAQTVTWLMLNRRNTKVAIRPVFNKTKQPPFQPDQAIYMDPPQVETGHSDTPFKDPETSIIDGFHIHMDYLKGQKKQALKLRDQFKTAAANDRIIYSDLDTYPERFNGPHLRAGWEVKFERAGSLSMPNYGYALAWLLLNHHNIPIYSHSKSWLFGENEKRLISHLDNTLYSGVKPKLDQWFFYNPLNEKTGLYRWDAQLPVTLCISGDKRTQKQADILQFWFGANTNEYPVEQSQHWFNKQHTRLSAFDKEIHDRFSQDLILMANHAYDDWQNTPRGALASVLLLDQFPRNIYRGTRMAFVFDEQALTIAKRAIQKGFDKQLSLAERLFLYMPLEHSEAMQDQIMAVTLMEKLKNEAGPNDKKIFEKHHAMAVKHKMTIEAFGYFPSRHLNFDRENTPKELQFMQQENARF